MSASSKRTHGRPLAILSWNLENFARYAGAGSSAPPLAEIVEGFGRPDVVCLQEVRVRPQDPVLARLLGEALPGYACQVALARDPKNATFRGGRTYGVATYVRDTPVSFRTLDEDREGRLVIAELPEHRLALFNVYAVNGTSRPYYDHALGAYHGDRHAFKRRFQSLLLQEGQAYARHGLALVMIGDWNVSRTRLDIVPRLRTAAPHTRARHHLNAEVIPALDLVDAFRELHPDARQYTWFNRLAPPGTLDAARVDYALISRRLLPAVVRADIAEDARHGSDHAPIRLDLAL